MYVVCGPDAALQVFVVVSGQVEILARSERGDVNDGVVSEGQVSWFSLADTRTLRAFFSFFWNACC